MTVFGIRFGRVSGVRLYFQQFYALLIKHLIHSQRNIVLTIVQIALPVIFTIFACLIEKTIAGPTDPPALSLNLTHFDEPIVAWSTGPSLTTDANTLSSDYGTIAGAWGTADSSVGQYMDAYLLDQAKNLDHFKRHYLIAG
jgi:ATP-binding cassette subfamily A (ABC1) protein 3